MFVNAKQKIKILTLLSNLFANNYLIVTMFILVFSFSLSGIVTTIAIKFFPNQEIVELDRQNGVISIRLARFNQRMVMFYEINQIRERKLSVQNDIGGNKVDNIDRPVFQGKPVTSSG